MSTVATRMAVACLLAAAMTLTFAAAHADPPRAARPGWLPGDAIRTELTGGHLAGIYPNKVGWKEQINPDGSTDYQEGDRRRPGQWNIADDQFCFVYADPPPGGCFRVIKHNSNCYELYTTGIGGDEPAAPASPEGMPWNGRMWRDGVPTTCEDVPTS